MDDWIQRQTRSGVMGERADDRQGVLDRVGDGGGPGNGAALADAPLAPRGMKGEGCSRRSTSMAGTSAAVGFR